MHDAPTSTRPQSVSLLGYGGLIPFVGLTLAMGLDPLRSTIWRDALLSYGAIILSFVGALHWAFAMLAQNLSDLIQRQRYAWSVVPALAAWFTLLIPPLWAGIILAIFFVAHYDQDRRFARHTTLPTWYLGLRLQLTLVASLCVLFGALTAP